MSDVSLGGDEAKNNNVFADASTTVWNHAKDGKGQYSDKAASSI